MYIAVIFKLLGNFFFEGLLLHSVEPAQTSRGGLQGNPSVECIAIGEGDQGIGD